MDFFFAFFVRSVLSYITHLCRLTEQQGFFWGGVFCAVFVYSCSRFRATRGGEASDQSVMRIHLYSIRQCACSQVFPLQLCSSITLFGDSSTKAARPHSWVIWSWMFAAAQVKGSSCIRVILFMCTTDSNKTDRRGVLLGNSKSQGFSCAIRSEKGSEKGTGPWHVAPLLHLLGATVV